MNHVSFRKISVIANWKMNKNYQEVVYYINTLQKYLKNRIFNSNIVICVPYIYLQKCVEMCKNTPICIGSQDVSYMKNGSYTGEISTNMLNDVGVEYAIVGHSERRTLFNETDTTINKKVLSALSNNLKVILCVGESIDENSVNATKEKISYQLKMALKGVNKGDLDNIIIAYEPIWSIGTGNIPDNAIINRVTNYIKTIVGSMYDISEKNVQVLYGGSVSTENFGDILRNTNINGGLIGKTSLDIEKFLQLIEISDKYAIREGDI